MTNNYDYTDFSLKEVEVPMFKGAASPVLLTDATMAERQNIVLNRMRKERLDVLIVYADLEHGSNFEYLTGFLPRFEESILVLHKTGDACLLLGNENNKMVKYSRIPAKGIHVPYFSLPNQPMDNDREIAEYFMEAGLRQGLKTGVAGWKLFTSSVADNEKLFDLPGYLVDAIRGLVGAECMVNSSHIFISAKDGARIINNANEIAHYEYGASLASDCVLQAMNHVRPGITELELGNYLSAAGQRNSVVTIAAAGERFEYANFYPLDKCVKIGDKMSLTVGYKGGLTSRSGYAVESERQLAEPVRDYIPRLAAPYFAAVTAWLENITIGMAGGALCQLIQEVLPQEIFCWKLNPGHLCSDEEWMSSPIYPGSKELLKSGMILQTDIIPGIDGYAGVSCESGIVLADESLRQQIQREYPELFEVFMKRRNYIRNELNINLSKDVLPMTDTVAYYRPFFLNPKAALVKKNIAGEC